MKIYYGGVHFLQLLLWQIIIQMKIFQNEIRTNKFDNGYKVRMTYSKYKSNKWYISQDQKFLTISKECR